MKVLIAPDKFKGTLSAHEAAAAMAAGVRQFNPTWEVAILPIADGGEGTAEVLSTATGGSMISVRANDPLFRSVTCEMGISGDGKTAYIDLASASGFLSLEPHEINPMMTSTIGTGQLVAAAINRKCKRIIIGLGGSSTVDCGTGIVHALGAVFINEARNRVSPLAANLGKIEFINLDNLRPELQRVEILLLADVDGPLLGEDGVMRYADQKGLKDADRQKLAEGVQHFANLMEAQFSANSKLPGMAAAGGAAFCAVSMIGAKLTSGADFILDALDAQQAIADADLILTGEGHLDLQSLFGKAPFKMAQLAQSQGKHVAAICGQVSLSPDQWRQAGFDQASALFEPGASADAIRLQTRTLLTTRTREALAELAPRLG
jgi:glycerate 2-kinase